MGMDQVVPLLPQPLDLAGKSEANQSVLFLKHPGCYCRVNQVYALREVAKGVVGCTTDRLG